MKTRSILTATLVVVLSLAGCSSTTVDAIPARLGEPSTMAALLVVINEPGPIVFQKHVAGDWAVELSGLINLDNPKAIAAGLKDRIEPIQIYTYSLTHPAHGTFLIDSGLSEKFRDAPNNDDIAMILKLGMDLTLDLKVTTRELATQFNGIDGVFLTHIHLDHIMGLTDLSSDVPVYIGPGDAGLSTAMNAVTQGTTDRLLGNVTELQEWQYSDSGVIDIFGDGSVWAIHSPGHTPGATAYIARTTMGPQLMLGDTTHTKWGWENGVEPGTFSTDIPQSVTSLNRLIKLAKANPRVQVHPGHQSL
jgi:N-acyl homoserine lactone hydrolase